MRQNKITQLSDVEHVLKKPGMYLGDMSATTSDKYVLKDGNMKKGPIKYCPAILKLFDEIVSNSIDEALRTDFKYANRIDVNVEGNTIKVRDNGRGIPVSKDKDTGISQAVMAFTSLRAGANFTDESFVSIGTHGLGATLVNIMSTIFRAETNDGTKGIKLVCSKNMSSTDVRNTKKGKQGTYVEFTPDFSRFGIKGLGREVELIEKRIADLAVCFPDITFRFNGKIVRLKSFKNYVNLYSDKSNILQNDNFQLAVFPVSEPETISFVNGIDTYEGGNHTQHVSTLIVGKLLTLLNKKYKKLNIKPADVRNHLGMILITNKIADPKFRSQTKEYITNPVAELKPIFEGCDEDKFVRAILRNVDIIDAIVETKRLKAEAQERVALKAAKRKAKKIKVAAHIPANDRNPEKKTLFITEGQSAIGQLCNVRDPRYHGGYPLKGKVLNINGMTGTQIVKNKELNELMSIIGLSIGDKPTNLNYGNIAILADADVDGGHIVTLLINFFMQWPDLFHENRISVIKSPILISKKGRQIKRFYDIIDFDGEKYRDWQTTYFKGLGGLSTEEYENMLHNPVKDVITIDDDADKLIDIAFGKNAQLRKDWLAS